MINVRDQDVANHLVTFFCEECEARFGIPVEIKINLRKPDCRGMDKFKKAHIANPCDKTPMYDEAGEAKFQMGVNFARECYAEDPKMPFTEIRKRYQQRKADLAEIQTPETDL